MSSQEHRRSLEKGPWDPLQLGKGHLPAAEKRRYWEKGTPDTRHLRGRGTKALHLLIQHEAEEIKVGRSLKSERPTSFLRPGFEPPPIGGIRIRER